MAELARYCCCVVPLPVQLAELDDSKMKATKLVLLALVAVCSINTSFECRRLPEDKFESVLDGVSEWKPADLLPERTFMGLVCIWREILGDEGPDYCKIKKNTKIRPDTTSSK